MLCEAKIGDKFIGLFPLGHFVLQERISNKFFIGTGTGFAPLYYQICKAIENNFSGKIHFVFGVRFTKDNFYLEKIQELQKIHKNFSYSLYFSQEKNFENSADIVKNSSGKFSVQSGYVTDFLTVENLENYDEFYICGSPAMVKSAKEKLLLLGKNSENIFSEQY